MPTNSRSYTPKPDDGPKDPKEEGSREEPVSPKPKK